MDDLISRQAAIDMLATMQGRCTSKTALIQNSKIWQQIKDLPSAQPEQKKGEWIKNEGRFGWHCSECKVDNYYAYVLNSETGKNDLQDRYCPFCGAEMLERRDDG